MASLLPKNKHQTHLHDHLQKLTNYCANRGLFVDMTVPNMTIFSLPTNILHMIISQETLGWQDRFLLCQVKPFKQVAVQLLKYCVVTKDYRMLLQILAKCPSEAAQIKSMTFTFPLNVGIPAYRTPEYIKRENNLVSTTLNALNLRLPMKRRWYASLRRAEPWSFIGLILVHLPNVEKILVGSQEVGQEDINLLLLQVPSMSYPSSAGGSLKHCFNNLKAINVYIRGLTLSNLLPVFHNAALTKAFGMRRLSDTNDQSQNLAQQDPDNASDQFTQAFSHGSGDDVPSADAIIFFRACKHLRAHQYKGCPFRNRDMNPKLLANLRKVLDALQNFTVSLEELSLGMEIAFERLADSKT